MPLCLFLFGLLYCYVIGWLWELGYFLYIYGDGIGVGCGVLPIFAVGEEACFYGGADIAGVDIELGGGGSTGGVVGELAVWGDGVDGAAFTVEGGFI